MIPMNNDLQIGQPAIIIGCYNPSNSWIIGRVVTVVELISAGEKLSDEYFNGGNPFDITAPVNLAMVTGVNTELCIIDNHALIQQKYLMPIPPLDDDVLDEVECSTQQLEKVN